VEEKVRHLRDANPDYLQAQAVLTRQTGGDLLEMACFFSQMGFTGAYVGFAHSPDRRSNFRLTEKFFTPLQRKYISLLESCMVEAHPCRFDLSGHDKILRRIYRAEPSFYACPTHAGISMVHAEPDGNVYPCYRLLQPDLNLGTLTKGMKPAQARRISQRFMDDRVDQNACATCWARYLCGGICAARSSDRNKDISPNSCRQRELMLLNLKLYARLWHRHRPLLDSLYGTNGN
jgi:radical SAM protein with 4Fe4S-binding SPASM domain